MLQHISFQLQKSNLFSLKIETLRSNQALLEQALARQRQQSGPRAAASPWEALGAPWHPQELGQGWDDLPPAVCAPVSPSWSRAEVNTIERGTVILLKGPGRLRASGRNLLPLVVSGLNLACSVLTPDMPLRVPVMGLSAGCSRALEWVSGYYIPLFYLQFNLLILRTAFLSPPTSPLPPEAAESESSYVTITFDKFSKKNQRTCTTRRDTMGFSSISLPLYKAIIHMI